MTGRLSIAGENINYGAPHMFSPRLWKGPGDGEARREVILDAGLIPLGNGLTWRPANPQFGGTCTADFTATIRFYAYCALGAQSGFKVVDAAVPYIGEATVSFTNGMDGAAAATAFKTAFEAVPEQQQGAVTWTYSVGAVGSSIVSHNLNFTGRAAVDNPYRAGISNWYEVVASDA